MSDSADVRELPELPLEELIACHECDLLMRKPFLHKGQRADCPRCGFELYSCRHDVARRSLALVLAALLLFIPANFLPIMRLHLFGQATQDTVWSAVLGLYRSDMQGIAVLVFLCSMGIPLLKLLCQLAVLLSIRWNTCRGHGLLLYRIYHHLRDWGMLEVYLIGILVAIVKLRDTAELTIGFGLACFVALLLVQLALEAVMSPHQVWEALSNEDVHESD